MADTAKRQLNIRVLAKFRYQIFLVILGVLMLAIFAFAVRSIQESFEKIVSAQQAGSEVSVKFQMELLAPLADRLKIDPETFKPLE